MYFVGYSKWLLLCSRLVAGEAHVHTWRDPTQSPPSVGASTDGSFFFLTSGVGAGAGSSIFGFLTRSTRPEERAAVFAAVMACRQVGLVVGQFHRRMAEPVGERRRLLFDASPPSLQGRRSTSSCGCVISGWGRLW